MCDFTHILSFPLFAPFLPFSHFISRSSLDAYIATIRGLLRMNPCWQIAHWPPFYTTPCTQHGRKLPKSTSPPDMRLLAAPNPVLVLDKNKIDRGSHQYVSDHLLNLFLSISNPHETARARKLPTSLHHFIIPLVHYRVFVPNSIALLPIWYHVMLKN